MISKDLVSDGTPIIDPAGREIPSVMGKPTFTNTKHL